MSLQRALGGATARSARAHVAVRTEGCVTLRTAPAGVGWAGRGPAVTQVHLQGKVFFLKNHTFPSFMCKMMLCVCVCSLFAG